MKVTDTEQMKELRDVLCARCYRWLAGWIDGKTQEPFIPCDDCEPKLQTWLERQRNSHGARRMT